MTRVRMCGTYVSLASVASHLRQEKIHTKGCVLVLKIGLDFVNAILKDLRVLMKTTNDTDTTLRKVQFLF